MSKKQLTKTQSQRWHSKWNVSDRYGIFCNRFTYRDILNLVLTKQATLLVKQSNTRWFYKVYFDVSEVIKDKRTNIRVPLESDGKLKIYLIYDSKRNELVTTLPWYATDEAAILDYETNHKYVRE